jgi:hypothetical protein
MGLKALFGRSAPIWPAEQRETRPCPIGFETGLLKAIEHEPLEAGRREARRVSWPVCSRSLSTCGLESLTWSRTSTDSFLGP